MKKKYVILLDTETLNGISDGKGGVDLTDSLVYDLGWQVIDLHGNVYEQRSYTIYDTFVEMKQEMKSAYYANKIPKYEQEIKSGQRTLARLSTARKQLYDDMIKYNSNIVCAHNCSFDLRALNNTIRYITKSKFRYFFPRGTIFWDTLKMANQTYKNEWGYRKFCEQNGYMTKHKVPQPRMTAEIIFRYISGDDVFEEEHTGLADVQIESEILWAIMRKHKKLDRELFSKGGVVNLSFFIGGALPVGSPPKFPLYTPFENLSIEKLHKFLKSFFPNFVQNSDLRKSKNFAII